MIDKANNVLDNNHNELEKKVFNNIKKLSKKHSSYSNKPLKKRKKYYSKRTTFFEDLGIDNAIPIRVYQLEGKIGSKDAHFTEVNL